MFQTKAVEKIKTFFSKIVLLLDNMEKYCTARQVMDVNMAHEHCMLDT